MSNLVILPIIFPLLAGIILAFTNKYVPTSRILTKVFALLSLGISAYLLSVVLADGTVVLETGSWAAPYGIVFVADPLAAIIVLTTNIVATACAFYAQIGRASCRESVVV